MVTSAGSFEYRIKPGESLSMIMGRFYGVGASGPDYNRYLHQILSLNPHIQAPDVIPAGSILRLMATPAPVAAPPPAVRIPPYLLARLPTCYRASGFLPSG
ncbi:LysM domain-containing protein [Halopseudomonas salegens]|uniref:LysM domain-containing protein n=1 Tax=Halopseudomonas salegens TaxID=1434072 RepID=A0A1H2G6X3_9GAMM|nr:LysM domain-containing protein [Halopseudomonas salegens]